MALIKCKECKNDVSTTAKTCPQCGAKVPTNKTRDTIIGAAVIIGIAIWFGAGNKDNKQNTAVAAQQLTEQPQKSLPVIKATASELYKSYAENEVATDDKLKGHLVEITGRIQSIDKDITDSVVVTLATTNQFSPARMSLPDSENAKAATLKKGATATLRCEKMMRLIGSPSGSDCKII